MARIEIKPGDEFGARSSIWQIRGDQARNIDWGSASAWGATPCINKHVSREDAIAHIRSMGHEVVEVTPEPAPVRITHGCESALIPGLIAAVGTKEACERQLKFYTNYRVVPITF